VEKISEFEEMLAESLGQITERQLREKIRQVSKDISACRRNGDYNALLNFTLQRERLIVEIKQLGLDRRTKTLKSLLEFNDELSSVR